MSGGTHRRRSRRSGGRALQVALLWTVFGLVAMGIHSLVEAPAADAQAEQRGGDREDPVERGEGLWRRDCASCHGPEGDGTPWGPGLHDKGPAGVHLTVSTGRMPLEDLSGLQETAPGEDDRQVPRSRHGGTEYLPGQVAALVAYSSEILRGPEVPSVDVASADVSHGAELFQRNCVSCHAWSGRGGALTNGHTATSLEGSSPIQVVEAMRTGLGTMPTYTEGVVSDEEAADLAAYVDYLQHPRTEGGHPLAFVGPAAEGLVAGVVGLLGLLLFVRWIGRRS